jgi:hypothetical protein
MLPARKHLEARQLPGPHLDNRLKRGENFVPSECLPKFGGIESHGRSGPIHSTPHLANREAENRTPAERVTTAGNIGNWPGEAKRVKTALHLLRALDGANASHPAQAKDHAIQMPQVFGFHHELDSRLALRSALGIDAANIRIVVGDDGGEFF